MLDVNSCKIGFTVNARKEDLEMDFYFFVKIHMKVFKNKDKESFETYLKEI